MGINYATQSVWSHRFAVLTDKSHNFSLEWRVDEDGAFEHGHTLEIKDILEQWWIADDAHKLFRLSTYTFNTDQTTKTGKQHN